MGSADRSRQEESEEHGWIDGIAIVVAVVVVVLVSSVTDWKKERQFRSLQNKIDLDHTFTVLRGGGELVQLPVSDLVVGDIVLVKYGTTHPSASSSAPAAPASPLSLSLFVCLSVCLSLCLSPF